MPPKNTTESQKNLISKLKNVSTQTETQSMNYVPVSILSGMRLDEDAYPSFFAKPHMVILLVGMFLFVVYFVVTKSLSASPGSFINNSQW